MQFETLRFSLRFDLKTSQIFLKNSEIVGNSHSLWPLCGHGVELCIKAGKTGTPRRRHDSDGGTTFSEARVMINPRVWASSMQQTRGLEVMSLNPIQPTDCFSMVYILHSPPVLTSCLASLPVMLLSAVYSAAAVI